MWGLSWAVVPLFYVTSSIALAAVAARGWRGAVSWFFVAVFCTSIMAALLLIIINQKRDYKPARRSIVDQGPQDEL